MAILPYAVYRLQPPVHCLKTPEHLSPKPISCKITTFVAGPEVDLAAGLGVSSVADPDAVSPVVEFGVSAAADPTAVSVAAALEAGSVAVDPKIVSVVAQPEVFAAVEPEAVFAAAQLQVASGVVAPEAVSVDIAVAFVVLVLASVVVAEADSSERPRSLAFPNADHFASSSSAVEVAGEESVHSPIGVHTSYGLCSILSSLDLHHNRNLE